MIYGYINIIDSSRFLSTSLDELIKNLDEDDFRTLKKEFPDKGYFLNKKLAYLYESFNCIQDYQKPVANLRKHDFFDNLKNTCPDDIKIGRRKQVIKLFDSTNGEELTKLNMKTYNILLDDVLEMFTNVSVKNIESIRCIVFLYVIIL